MNMRSLILVAILLMLAGSVAQATTIPVAILGPTPPGPMNCVAVEVETPPTGITGFRWFHNDESQSFPRLVVVEGAPGEAPDLTSSGLVLFELSGSTLTWGEVNFGGPITSSTGTAYVVIFFPEDTETLGMGDGGGPGIGVRSAENGKSFFVSADGANWGRFDPSYELAIETVVSLARAQPRVLSEMDAVALEGLGTVDDSVIPTRTVFRKPFPNPFNPRVELSFALAKGGVVRVEVYDVRGRRVKTLQDQSLPVGEHRLIWDGDDDAGVAVASGVYFARFTSPDEVITHRMALIR